MSADAMYFFEFRFHRRYFCRFWGKSEFDYEVIVREQIYLFPTEMGARHALSLEGFGDEFRMTIKVVFFG